jgi:hypothetical protein
MIFRGFFTPPEMEVDLFNCIHGDLTLEGKLLHIYIYINTWNGSLTFYNPSKLWFLLTSLVLPRALYNYQINYYRVF